MTLVCKRRKRRREKAKLKNKKVVRRHMRKTGRTGSIHEKRTPSSKHFEYVRIIPNNPTWWPFDIHGNLTPFDNIK